MKSRTLGALSASAAAAIAIALPGTAEAAVTCAPADFHGEMVFKFCSDVDGHAEYRLRFACSTPTGVYELDGPWAAVGTTAQGTCNPGDQAEAVVEVYGRG